MKLLALDTCLGACSAAVLKDGKIATSRRALMQRGHAEVISPMVDAVMAETGLSPSDLDRIAVTTGPGSFTGVRIGLSLAQGLGLGLKIPVTGIDTMLATAAPLLGTGAVTVCHAAGASGYNYVQHFSDDGRATSAIELLRAEKVVIDAERIVIGSAANSFSNARRQREFDVPDAVLFAPLAAALPYGAMPRPLYIRDADAKPQAGTFKVPDYVIETAGPGAAPALAQAHARSFYEAWPAADLASMLDAPGTLALVARANNDVLGFVLARAIAGEAEILTICTDPKARGNGIGAALLGALQGVLRALKITDLFLEVAADNDGAIRLYQAAGFAQSGLRKDYYQRRDGRCDALMFRLRIS